MGVDNGERMLPGGHELHIVEVIAKNHRLIGRDAKDSLELLERCPLVYILALNVHPVIRRKDNRVGISVVLDSRQDVVEAVEGEDGNFDNVIDRAHQGYCPLPQVDGSSGELR